MNKKLMNSLLVIGVVLIAVTSCSKQPGPQTPSCGIVEVTTNEVIAGQQFPKGKYQINVFGLSCEEVMGDEGLFSKFLQLGDNEVLPEPWSYLEGAVGAPKFVKGTGVGFRAERVGD
ncbi:MAG: hypothetical protein IPL84_07650 [Chitinophagaceae bacterium]|nr:hypothetical protein [Chitinophagaceae bacterium]